MSRRKLTGKTPALAIVAAQQQPQTIPVRVILQMMCDGQPLNTPDVIEGNLPLPADGEAAQIHIALDGRKVLKALSEQIGALDSRAKRGGVLVPKSVAPSDLILPGTAPLRD